MSLRDLKPKCMTDARALVGKRVSIMLKTSDAPLVYRMLSGVYVRACTRRFITVAAPGSSENERLNMGKVKGIFEVDRGA